MDADGTAVESHGGRRPLVVVGVDGSSNGLHAVAWAAPHASQMGAVLRILAAWLPPTLLVPVFAGIPKDGSDRAVDHAHRAEQLASEVAPGLAIEIEVVELPPIQALMDASRGADLLVVGRRGLGGLRGLLLGSVSQHCAEHALCPLVVVPETGD